MGRRSWRQRCPYCGFNHPPSTPGDRVPHVRADEQMAWSCWRCRKLWSEEETGQPYTVNHNVVCPKCGGSMHVRNV